MSSIQEEDAKPPAAAEDAAVATTEQEQPPTLPDEPMPDAPQEEEEEDEMKPSSSSQPPEEAGATTAPPPAPSSDRGTEDKEPEKEEEDSEVPEPAPEQAKQPPTEAAAAAEPAQAAPAVVPPPRVKRSTRSNPVAAAAVAESSDAALDLDEPLLDEVVDFLSSPTLAYDILDEEDVLVLMHRTTKSASQKTRNYRSLVDSDAYDDPDDELFQECLTQAEDQTLSEDLIQDLNQYLENGGSQNAENAARLLSPKRPAVKKLLAHNNPPANAPEPPKRSLDRKTMSWVKRTIGVGLRKRQSNNRFPEPNTVGGNGAAGGARRYTRGMARVSTSSTGNKRSKKQKREMPMDTLRAAISEMAKERGQPFRLPSLRQQQRERRAAALLLQQQQQAAAEEAGGGERSRTSGSRPATSSSSRAAKARAKEEAAASRRAARESARAKRKREKEEAKAARARKKRKKAHKRAQFLASESPYISLVDLENQRRELGNNSEATSAAASSKGSGLKVASAASSRPKISYESRASVELPDEMSQLGIIHRLPRWNKFSRAIVPISNRYQPPPSGGGSGTPSSKSAPSNGPDTWLVSICENFCSDIDRAWYESARKQVKRAGGIIIGPGHEDDLPWDPEPKNKDEHRRLFRATPEWKTARRQWRKRPRRFSRKFLQDELQDRNDFRQIIRFVQQNPARRDELLFPHAIPIPYRSGTLISAINWKRRIVQRGIVLNYDFKSNTCFIQFEGGDVTVCPDSEVFAREVQLMGYPNTPTYRPPPPIAPLPRSNLLELKKTANGFPAWSLVEELIKFDPLAGPEMEPSAKSSKPAASAKGDSLVERVAEREALVALMGAINKTLVRKELLLDALEKLEDLVKNRIPPDSIKEKSVSNHVSSHRAWMEKCIRQTDSILERRLEYLAVFYGAAFLPEEDVVDTKLTRKELEELFNHMADSSCGVSASTDLVCAKILNGVRDFSETLTSSALYRSSAQRAKVEPCLRTSIELLLASAFTSTDIPSSYLSMVLSEDWMRMAMGRLWNNVDVDASDPLLAQVEQEREDALKDLNAAMAMYHAELTFSHLESAAKANF